MLGAGYTGSGEVMLAGLRWADRAGVRRRQHEPLDDEDATSPALLHELADSAYFQRTVLVASAHNMPVESFPWRFSSVISVGSHEAPTRSTFYCNPDPPVEFFARGVEVDVAWLGGSTLRCTGNSFATPHVTGLCALVLCEAPGADAVPAEERALPHREQRRRGMSERSRCRGGRRRRSPPKSCTAR